MKNFSKELGSYMPSFYYMKLTFPFYDAQMALYNLSKKNLSVFIHEYIHFLQDISSYSLLNNAYVYTEYIHAAVNCVYKMPKGKIRVPISIPVNYKNVYLNQMINSICMGSVQDCNTMFITDIKFERHHAPKSLHLTIPQLKLANGKNVDFGIYAIMESMAYMIERKITQGSVTPPDFPYNAAMYVVNYIYPEFGKEEFNVIALCDISLQFSNPGRVFVQTLKKMHDESFLPLKAELIYDYMYAQSIELMGEQTTLDNALMCIGMISQKRMKEYMKGELFDGFRKIIDEISFGYHQRIANRYFMLDIARGGLALWNKKLVNIMSIVGSPLIQDSQNRYSYVPIAGRSKNEYWQYFPAIEQIYKCFSEGCDVCEMIDLCENKPEGKTCQNNDMSSFAEIDECCWNAPWQRSSMQHLCPYALLWKHWNLMEWEPYS